MFTITSKSNYNPNFLNVNWGLLSQRGFVLKVKDLIASRSTNGLIDNDCH